MRSPLPGMDVLQRRCRAAIVVCVCTLFLMAVAIAAHAAEPSTGDDLAARGWQAFERGGFAVAVGHWEQAARAYAQAGNPSAQSVVLTQLSHAYQALGHDQKALASLASALPLAKQAKHGQQVAAILGDLGNVHLAMGRLPDAAKWLAEGLQAARDLGDTGLEARILHNTGNLHRARAVPDEALQHYLDSLALASAANDPRLARCSECRACRHVLETIWLR